MQQESLPTFFAPAERASAEDLRAQRKAVEEFGQIKSILDVLPYVAGIINRERQFVYANQAMLELLEVQSAEDVWGKRWGEVINCIHAFEPPNGCGTTEHCRYCGAVQTVMESQIFHKTVSHEARLTATRGGMLTAFDVVVTATPYVHNGMEYAILTVKDISNEKRRRALEQIFFHDIINHVQSVSGILACTEDLGSLEEVESLLALARMASHEMMDGILSQRDLLAAENSEIRLSKRYLKTRTVLNECASVIRHHFAAVDRKLEIDPRAVDELIETDETLLKRILTNMIKNALEATPIDGTVRMGCEKRENGGVRFWTHNASVMPRTVQLQIFQRSYSTKGANRGLGTYSMKLLGEHYLGGSVYFTSTEDEGTTFYLELPLTTPRDH